MAETYKLTYFNLRALAEPIRLIFAYAGVEYEDVRIEREQWPEQKENYPWGQLPVLQVGDKTLCQSNTIGRFLARKFNLAGEDEWESAKIDELVDALTDLRSEWRKFFMEQDETKKAELKKAFVETAVPKYFGKFEAQIASNNGGPYLVGKNLTWVDIQTAHFLEFFEVSKPGLLDSYTALKKLRETVFENDKIKAWLEKRPVTQF
ncbi:Glutathione S-transferase [Orchesella cincta]|uniref:glutathione transferase n=1 Tax=Orchesella cincta TaxID=48709 RepID=A0A1D2MBU5_ORCCI|nr:Glutathione S-transferase [Orchesella cincta]